MKKATWIVTTLLLAAMAPAQEQAVPEDQVIDRFIAREQLLVQNLHSFAPLVETYIQYMRPDAELGRMNLSSTITEARYTAKPGRARRVMGVFSGLFTVKFAPEGFDGLILVDGEHFDRNHYDFTFVRREFLGDIRTLAYDVKPKKGSRAGFLGRIWVEDQEYNIVRFNGTHAA
jgi:hypothetical protein